jgi:hypothetical protein
MIVKIGAAKIDVLTDKCDLHVHVVGDSATSKRFIYGNA